MKLIVQPDADILPVLSAIRRARRYIYVCIFRIDRQEIVRALAASAQRGVQVHALIANTNTGGSKRLRETEHSLLEGGVTVARTADDLIRYHGKFMVTDDILHLFGFNFTRQDIERSRSFGIATRDLRTVKEAIRLFEADRRRQAYTASRSNLVVSPETSREMLSRFLRGARRQLAVYDLKVQDPMMIRILNERARKGVEVRILGHMKSPADEVQVRPFKGMRLHVRAIVRDGTRAFVGSQGMRKAELDKRREVGLLISNPTVTRKILQVFESDWAESTAGEKEAAQAREEKEKDRVEKEKEKDRVEKERVEKEKEKNRVEKEKEKAREEKAEAG